MDIRELYSEIDGNYDELIGRLGSEKIVNTLLKLFVSDESFQNLNSSMCEKDYVGAFRAVHGLKGLCANLSIKKLEDLAAELTEYLRNETDINGAEEIFPQVCAEYGRVLNIIESYIQQ